MTKYCELSWLNYLANRKQAQLFLKNYKYGSDVVLDCQALEMRLVLEKPVAVWPAVRELWAVGKTRPDECDPIFDRWRKAGVLLEVPGHAGPGAGDSAGGVFAGLTIVATGSLKAFTREEIEEAISSDSFLLIFNQTGNKFLILIPCKRNDLIF